MAALADLVLILHFGVVLFVVLGAATFIVGGARGWAWTRRLGLRVSHLAAIVCIAAEAWLSIDCPLTVWEQQLRAAAGQATYRESFVEHWISRLMFFDLPPAFFVAAYTAFLALVAWTWWRYPPRRPS